MVERAQALVTDDLLDLSAVFAVRAMRQGDLTAERYASALLDRCEAMKGLNAFISLDAPRVLEAARAADRRRTAGEFLGPLHGLPIPVKDSVNTKDLPTTVGTPALRSFRPAENAAVVQTLLDAGAIVLGKTNLHELSLGWTSNNHAFGAVHNPYDTKRIPGGSSGGTAAAVAARMAPLGVAEDTEGSIRVPAALCGITGFRPTTFRYSSTGVAPITPLFDQVGPHARSVEDLALFDSVATGNQSPLPTITLKGLRLGLAREYFYAGLDPEVERQADQTLRILRAAGVEIVEANLPDLEKLIAATTAQIQIHDLGPSLKKYLAEFRAGVTLEQVAARASDDIREVFELFVLPGAKQAVSEEVYQAARDTLPKLRDTYQTYFRDTGVAAIAFPATMVPPTPIGEDKEVEIQGKKVAFETAVARNIAPGSTAGLPGLILPVGLTRGGLPLAFEFDGPPGTDRALLALGVELERTLGRIPAPGARRT